MSETVRTTIAVVGIDIGKNAFHVVGFDYRGAIVLRQKWSRGQVETRFANMPPCLIGMEACVGEHYPSRKLKEFGHNARLMPAKYVWSYSNDFRDAEAIAEAVQRSTMKFVATKTAEQDDSRSNAWSFRPGRIGTDREPCATWRQHHRNLKPERRGCREILGTAQGCRFQALARVAVLLNPPVFQAQILRVAERAASVLGVQLLKVGARGSDELDRAFAAITRESVGGLLVLGDPILIAHRARIIDFAAKNRLSAIYATKNHAEEGGLMSYGPDIAGQFHPGAVYVDKILNGVKPADLPVEQPTKFELVINLKTAKALGFAVPPALLARADELIE